MVLTRVSRKECPSTVSLLEVMPITLPCTARLAVWMAWSPERTNNRPTIMKKSTKWSKTCIYVRCTPGTVETRLWGTAIRQVPESHILQTLCNCKILLFCSASILGNDCRLCFSNCIVIHYNGQTLGCYLMRSNMISTCIEILMYNIP